MEIKYTIEDSAVRVALIGELDTPATIEIQPEIDTLLSYASRPIYIDCSQLTYIASSGLRQMIAFYKKSASEGGKLVLQNVTPDVMEIFSVTNFDKVFCFE